jgi:hypothetical protein
MNGRAISTERQERFDVTFMPHNRCLIYDHKTDTVINCTRTEAIGLSWAIRSLAGDKDAVSERAGSGKPTKFEQLSFNNNDV